MSYTLQSYLATTTQKAADELVTAFLRLPEDKRDWKPAEGSRSALDQFAECTLLNGYTVNLIQTRLWDNTGMDAYVKAKDEVAALEWDKLQALLKENTERVIATISDVPDDHLSVEVDMPWGKQSIADIVSYPYWNMSYHLGQINYIASQLGCLD